MSPAGMEEDMSEMPPGENWTPLISLIGPLLPPGDVEVEFWHPRWEGIVRKKWNDFHPAMNVYGLYWRMPEG
jgi:hypothetical protein